jgi:glycosyltransferase involved in cell wall biosynthesis
MLVTGSGLLMHTNPTLAIVIPAYKSQYLAKTLDSLVQQTNKDFTVYIGNDAGEEGIADIVNRYIGSLNITYALFGENLGQASLVKQWERCIGLIKEERWLWLLPDDDYADRQCVELFYRQLEQDDFDLFRFNVKFVRGNGEVFKTNAAVPPVQTAWDSLMEKLSFVRPSTVAEFIFSRKKFEQTRFKDIPLAWGTDDLLWYELGRDKGIYGTNDAVVYLRQSGLNISNNYTSLGLQKIAANFIFFEQLLHLRSFTYDLAAEGSQQQFLRAAQQHIMYNLQDYSLRLSLPQMLQYAIKANSVWGGGVPRNLRRFWLNNKRVTAKKKQKKNAG